jgi:hypothetical protein
MGAAAAAGVETGSEPAERSVPSDPRLRRRATADAIPAAPVPPGFPLSAHGRSLKLQLGYHLRELACHSAAAYAQRLRRSARGDAAELASLHLHARRAALEVLLKRRAGDGPMPQRARCGTIKGAACMPFAEYCNGCMGKMGLAPLLASEREHVQTELTPLLDRWRQAVALSVVRHMLAPLYEALLLLDRLLYLGEGGHHAALFPVFDPDLSPRNYLLLGARPTAKVTAGAVAAALPPHAIAILQPQRPCR